MQLLAWMWCIAFSLYFSSWYLFGITVVSHFVFIIAIFVTVMSFRLVPEPEDEYLDDLDGVDWDEED
jgi:magnesium-transporting ATPase (P-type)